MGCNCNSAKQTRESYIHVGTDGKQTPYASETEVKAAAARKGGTWKKA